jgi:hypothetical protein
MGITDQERERIREEETTRWLVRQELRRQLERASAADLKRVGVHVERGEESLEHLHRLYAGHDLLHLRQLERVRRAVA